MATHIMHNKDKEFPAKFSEDTRTMVIKHKDKLVKLFVTLHYKIAKKNTAA